MAKRHVVKDLDQEFTEQVAQAFNTLGNLLSGRGQYADAEKCWVLEGKYKAGGATPRRFGESVKPSPVRQVPQRVVAELIAKHSAWHTNKDGWRVCSAPGCDFRYGKHMDPATLAVSVHAVKELVNAGHDVIRIDTDKIT